MNSFKFDSAVNKELTTNEAWVLDITNLGGEMSDIPAIAENNDIITVTGDNSIQVTIPKDQSKKFPSAKKIMLMIFLAIRYIVCPDCGGVPKA